MGLRIGEGLVEMTEIASGVYLAKSLDKVNNGHITTSILITTEQDIEVPNPVVRVVELRVCDVGGTSCDRCGRTGER